MNIEEILANARHGDCAERIVGGTRQVITEEQLHAQDWRLFHRHTPEEIAKLREVMRDAAVDVVESSSWDLGSRRSVYEFAKAAYLAAKEASC